MTPSHSTLEALTQLITRIGRYHTSLRELTCHLTALPFELAHYDRYFNPSTVPLETNPLFSAYLQSEQNCFYELLPVGTKILSDNIYELLVLQVGREGYEHYEDYFLLTLELGDDQRIQTMMITPQAVPDKINLNLEHHGKILVPLLTHNDEHLFLRECLNSITPWADALFIIDDASSDRTVEIIKETLVDFPYYLLELPVSEFNVEYKLRQKQWEIANLLGYDWLVHVDSDQVYEPSTQDKLKQFVTTTNADFGLFQLFDMWNETEYREDHFWRAHLGRRYFMNRVRPGVCSAFLPRNQHCGNIPQQLVNEISERQNYQDTTVRLKHLGWSREELRLQKYQRYMTIPHGKTEEMDRHYQSILDSSPNLKKLN
jgi:hypothetical protein